VAPAGAAAACVGVRQALFPGWRAWLDGRPLPLDVSPYVPEQQANPGFIVLHVPPGEHTLSLAFGPTPARLAGMGLTLSTVASAGLLASALAATVLLTAGTGYLTWRGARPMWQPFATSLPALPPAKTAGVWRAPDLADGGSGRNGLLVNLAEAVRQGEAVVSSPTGAVLGPEQFVDVRQLTVPDDEDPLRGAPGTSRREWLYLHPPSEVSVDVALPPGRQAWLQTALALDPAVWRAPTGDGVRFTASLTPLDVDGATGGTVVVLERAVNPRARTEERRWLPVQADLSRWAGQTVRLTLRTRPGADITYGWAGWANPCVVVTDQARAPVE
jgi:hypothetical protein